MNTGRTLADLAAELERQTATRKDYIAPQGLMEAVVVERGDTAEVAIDGINGDPLPITPYAHGQLANHLGIPKNYYDRMHADQPQLLASNLNTWLHADGENRRMVRALDGKIRAVLSPKYRPLNNFDLAQTVLPVLVANRVQITSCELTETRMYIKGILPELSDELPEGLAYGGHARIGGDRGNVVAAIVISNSDIGAGTLRIEPSVFTTRCTNLAILAAAAMKKYHVGRASDANEDSREVFADETRIADDKAFWLKVRDVTMAAFNVDRFRAAIADIRASASRPITSDDLPKVVELAVTQLSLPSVSATGILKHLAAGGDLTQWGLSSAITRVANDAGDYEYATELERAGGKVLALAPADWQRIATVAA
jgi:hypothetical protein